MISPQHSAGFQRTGTKVLQEEYPVTLLTRAISRYSKNFLQQWFAPQCLPHMNSPNILTQPYCHQAVLINNWFGGASFHPTEPPVVVKSVWKKRTEMAHLRKTAMRLLILRNQLFITTVPQCQPYTALRKTQRKLADLCLISLMKARLFK